jgi:mannose-6-phosphate isomerase-like protein (cupin superfamily)
MAWNLVHPDDLEWTTREGAPGEGDRHVARLTEPAGFANSRANLWRYDPRSKGRRHRHPDQEETFVVVSGVLSIYLGDEGERHDVAAGGVVNVDAGTALQMANHGDEPLVLYAYGAPPDNPAGEMLDDVL